MVMCPGQLTVCPKSECVAGIRGEFLPLDEHPDRFQWEHPFGRVSSGTIDCDSLFSRVVANAVELCLSTELFKRRNLILMSPHVSVVDRKGQATAVNQDVLKDVGVLASRREACGW